MLTWDWNSSIGELKLKNEIKGKIKIYQGNALLIFLHEFEDEGKELYTMYNFFCDYEHFKNCVKDCPYIFSEWEEITFTKFPNSKIIKTFKDLNNFNIKITIQ